MTAVSSQNDISADGDAAGQDARTGLALLMLLAEAADPHAQDWVNRRVEQLEFLDTRAVRWQVSVDFFVPENACQPAPPRTPLPRRKTNVRRLRRR
jgi:hypothetical protein